MYKYFEQILLGRSCALRRRTYLSLIYGSLRLILEGAVFLRQIFFFAPKEEVQK